MSEYRKRISSRFSSVFLKGPFGTKGDGLSWVAPDSRGLDRLWIKVVKGDVSKPNNGSYLVSFFLGYEGIQISFHMMGPATDTEPFYCPYTNRTHRQVPGLRIPYTSLSCNGQYNIDVYSISRGDFVTLKAINVDCTEHQLIIVNLTALMMFEGIDLFTLSGSAFFAGNCIGAIEPQRGDMLPIFQNQTAREAIDHSGACMEFFKLSQVYAQSLIEHEEGETLEDLKTVQINPFANRNGESALKRASEAFGLIYN